MEDSLSYPILTLIFDNKKKKKRYSPVS